LSFLQLGSWEQSHNVLGESKGLIAMAKKSALIVEPGKYFSSGIFIFPDVSARRRGQLPKTPINLRVLAPRS
jgi:hypothetical protein